MLIKLSWICGCICSWALEVVVVVVGGFAILERFATPSEASATASSKPGAGTRREYHRWEIGRSGGGWGAELGRNFGLGPCIRVS